MDPISSFILAGTISLVFTILGAVIMYRIKRLDTKLDQLSQASAVHDTAISGLEKTSVTDGHVRSIVREEIQPLSIQMQALLNNVSVITEYIAEQRGYDKARAEIERRRTTDI